MMFDLLRQFRQQLYLMLGLSKAALFDLMDAIVTTRSTASLVQLSLSPLFRRQWSSLYKALEHFRLSANQLMVFLLMFVPLSPEQPLLLALDHTDCPRSYSPTLRERTFEHHATAIAGNKPISLGQGYSTLAVIPEMVGSWALPLRHDRISSFETPLQRGLFQLKQVCRRFTQRPVLLADSEYATAGLSINVLSSPVTS